jgi:hypothetical protein
MERLWLVVERNVVLEAVGDLESNEIRVVVRSVRRG